MIKSRKWTDKVYNDQQKKKTKGQTMIYKTLHRKLKTEQHDPIEKQWSIHVLPRKGKQLTTQL